MERPIPIAYLTIDRSEIETDWVEVDIAREMFRGKIIQGAAFDPKGKRMRSVIDK